VAAAASVNVNPNDLLSPAARAELPPTTVVFLQDLLAGSLRSVYLLFAGVAALATLVAMFLPGGPPRQVSEPGQEAPGMPVAAPVGD
jgi:hypothetical protein